MEGGRARGQMTSEGTTIYMKSHEKRPKGIANKVAKRKGEHEPDHKGQRNRRGGGAGKKHNGYTFTQVSGANRYRLRTKAPGKRETA